MDNRVTINQRSAPEAKKANGILRQTRRGVVNR